MNTPNAPKTTIDHATRLIDIATHKVICAKPDDSVLDAAALMADKRISCLVVSNADGAPIGIVTERDILHASRDNKPHDTPLAEVMTSPVIAVPAQMTYLDAYQLCLRNGIRHLVVTGDDGTIQGIVSETDFRLHINLTALAGHRQVTSAMNRTVFALPPDACLNQALELMQAHRDTCMVIVDNEQPIGVLTERDVVKLYSSGEMAPQSPVSKFMTRQVHTIPLDGSINEAAERMLTLRIRHLVVVDAKGRLSGLLSEHDLNRAMSLSLIDDKLVAEGAFLHTLVNTIPDLIWLKDVNGIYLACNPRFEHFFGASRADIVGKTDYDFVTKELADSFRQHDQMAMERNGPSVNEEWVTFASDGHRELLETVKTPMCDSQGRLIGVLGTARDITSRKRIEDALYFVSQKGWKENTEKFLDTLARYLGETLEVDYVIIDKLSEDPDYAETVALYAKGDIAPNIRYHLTDTPCENVMGRDFCCYPKQVQQRFPRDELLAQMDAESYAGTPLWDSDGRPIGLIAVLHGKPLPDPVIVEQLLKIVATRVAAEMERATTSRILQQQEREFRTLAENLPDNLIRYDAASRVKYANPATYTSLSPGILPVIGKTEVETYPDNEVVARYQAALEAVIASGEAAEIEITVPHTDGETRNHHIRFVAERDSDSNIIGALAIGRDITERKHFEKQLAEREELFHTVFSQAPNGIELIDPETLGFIEANPAACRMLGYTHEEFLALRLTDTQADMNETALRQALAGIADHPDGVTFENRHRTKSGDILDVEISARMLELSGKQMLVGVWRDITEHKRAEDALRINASVFETSQEAIIITDADNTISDVNPAFTRITGYKREEVIGQNPRLLSSGRQANSFYAEMWKALEHDKTWRGEIWNRRKSGELYAELLSISVIQDKQGQTQRHVGVFSDISYLKAHEAELSRVANHDTLTGLPNRRLLADRLSQAIIRAQRSGKMLAVCYLDLDGFKQVNDEFGHEAGDQLLIVISHRLQAILRADDTLARLGGDEFVMLFNEISHEQECLLVLDRILEAVSTPVPVGSDETKVSASLGVTFYPADHEDGDTLLRHADQAMYVAKQHGKNRYHLYDSQRDQQARSLYNSRQRVAQGLEDGEFELYFQPKIDLTSGLATGAEALIRWHHPEEGLLLPSEFLPLIESSAIEVQLGEWVMDNALYQLNHWHQQDRALELSINISAHHLQSPAFVDNLAQRLHNYPHIPRNTLQIEVLETAALSDIEQTSKTINACRELGVTFALDDFGTGYSSLAYLRKLSAETLKIDQSFVINMLNDDGDQAIVEGIIALAQTFGRKTVAEGIEQSELAETLRLAGCDFGQGFGIAHPMPAHEFLEWLGKRQ
jgi:diguanylate cyclase (GGDEF)-like protein/PAS domain S-box-containing protein